jgi:aminomethyltransferase
MGRRKVGPFSSLLRRATSLIFLLATHSFYLVTNAGRAERDIAWLEQNLAEWNSEHSEQVEMTILRESGLIALQGARLITTLPSSH